MASPLSPLRVYDMLYMAAQSLGYTCFDREHVFPQMAQILQSNDTHHLALLGPSGIGKTAVLQGFAKTLIEQRFPGIRPLPLVELDTKDLRSRLARARDASSLITFVEQAFATLPPCTLVLDDVDELLKSIPDPASVSRILTALLAARECRVILACSAAGWQSWREAHELTLRGVKVVEIEEVSEDTCSTIVTDRARYIAGSYDLRLHEEVPHAIVEYSQQLSGLPQPARSLQFFDEVCAAASVAQQSVVTRADVEQVFYQRIGRPRVGLARLRSTLATAVLDQPHVVEDVSTVLERAWLGLKNPQRPLGSFLFLGPSGVGKTEMARVLAHELYGTNASFVRIDMSEYKEAHSVQRLIGAPPGYVGYEAGGQLTSAVLKQPFSLILLDEIEKADPAVFDVFLQILEDGRLTDGQGTTVDFRKTIIIATSNLGVEQILAGWLRHEDITAPAWREKQLVPILTKCFRLEFLNRFEGMLVFSPLSEEALLHIAQLELEKISQRLAHHQIHIQVSPDVLQEKIRALADPRFGARPLKRWLESRVEEALAQQMLAE